MSLSDKAPQELPAAGEGGRAATPDTKRNRTKPPKMTRDNNPSPRRSRPYPVPPGVNTGINTAQLQTHPPVTTAAHALPRPHKTTHRHRYRHSGTGSAPQNRSPGGRNGLSILWHHPAAAAGSLGERSPTDGFVFARGRTDPNSFSKHASRVPLNLVPVCCL